MKHLHAVISLARRATDSPKALQSSVQPELWPWAITPGGNLLMAFSLESNWCWLSQPRPLPMRTAWATRKYWFQAFPFWQFHVLFNSLFKVLFIFPSRYLFAIGLSPIFSFRRYLPPILVCIPKQTDSWKTYHMRTGSGSWTGFSPSMMPCSKELVPRPPPKTFL